MSSQPMLPVNVKLRNQHISFGGIFVVAGCTLFIWNLITLINSDGYINFKTGIWMGSFTMLTGVLAVVAAKKDNKNCLLGSLIMNVVCALSTWLVIIFVSMEYSARADSSVWKIENLDGFVGQKLFGNERINKIEYMRFTMNYDMIVLIAMLVGCVMFIVHASMCCFDICACCAICCSCCSCCCTPYRPPDLLITNQPQLITMQTGGVPASGLPMQVMPGQVMPGQVNHQYPNYQYSQVPGPVAPQLPTGSYPVQPSFNPTFAPSQPYQQFAPMLPAPNPSGEMSLPPSYDDVLSQDTKK